MNYSTIKKVVACSLMSAVAFTANAQDSTMTTSTSSAKVFGGRAQYRTWSIGVNAGVLSPLVVIGGSNDYTNWDVNLGYGLSVRKQLGHAFGLEVAAVKGKLSGSNEDAPGSSISSFETELGYSATIKGVVNVATADFLRRENNVNFLIKAGYGLAAYAPKVTYANGTVLDWKDQAGGGSKTYVKEQFIPIGVGVKFKLSDRVNFDLGYDMNFLDGDNLDGNYAKFSSKDKWSYGYAGLEFSLGSSAKPNLDWVNPVALMYDELKDPTLRQEVEALKGRVSTLENTVNQLAADADGDGVSDKFDKCPGTPAGTVVDGAGCPIEFPKDTTAAAGTYSNIQFEFDSSVLRTSSYPTLDKVSSDLRANSSSILELDGHASAEGTEQYNMNLSRDRANSVKTYLVNSGVDANRISVKAFGETRPIASNATEEGRVLNRRVEIKPSNQ